MIGFTEARDGVEAANVPSGGSGRRQMKREWEEAIRDRETERIVDLINAGIPIDARDRHGQTALMIAARHGWGEVTDLLVDHGANLDVTAKFGLSALMLAVINRHPAVVETLVNAGADVALRGTGAPGFHGKTAAELADGSDQPAVARLIRERASLR